MSHSWVWLCLTLSSVGFGEGIDENALFGDAAGVLDTAAMVDSIEPEERTTAFSGELTAAAFGNARRDVLHPTSAGEASLSSAIAGNLFLDVRKPNGLKAFANLQVYNAPSLGGDAVSLKEIFIDANIRQRVYFRAGKQVLQWGRCYLWNPTDFLNVEKKSYFQQLGYREGAYGVRVNVPFGNRLNWYGFLDTRTARTPDSVGAAGKIEFLAGGVEASVMAWGKKGYRPVFGGDVSTGIGGMDVAAEFSVSDGSNTWMMKTLPGPVSVLAFARSDDWAPKVALNLSRSFTQGGFPDRIRVTAEGFWQRDGYASNMFDDHGTYFFAPPVLKVITPDSVEVVASGTKKDFLLGQGLFERNHYSRYYGALFLSCARFIRSDITASCNLVRNISDASMVVSPGISWQGLNDLSLSASLNVFAGPANREYTYERNAVSADLRAGVSF